MPSAVQWCSVTLCNVPIGAERLLRHLHKHKVPICLATSSDAYNFGLKTTHHTELFKVFHHKVTGEHMWHAISSASLTLLSCSLGNISCYVAASSFSSNNQKVMCSIMRLQVHKVLAAHMLQYRVRTSRTKVRVHTC